VFLSQGGLTCGCSSGEFWRTVLFRNGDELRRRQAEWSAALAERGWSELL
jgi:hypothetical protein